MDTTEHTDLGNALRFTYSRDNPYLRTDENGAVYLRMQRVSENGLPEPMALELSAGEIIAMAGDYYTEEGWTYELDLPDCQAFNSPKELGAFLVNRPIITQETNALIAAYNNLAAPEVSRNDIDRIYTINDANYIPFSTTLNFYMQQAMFYLRVKDYGQMLDRNQTHFTPWSIRVYMLGHQLALDYGQLASELTHWAKDSYYQSEHPVIQQLKQSALDNNTTWTSEQLQDLAYRYEAQAYCMELFTFHYYSDHFATGHMSIMGDLRMELPKRFGIWGSLLVNSLHDEVNRIGAFSIRSQDPTPDPTQAATPARGDGEFDTCLNHHNKQQCIDGMQASLADLQTVLDGKTKPRQRDFGGLEHMPDIDYDSRQHQPLIVYSGGKIFYRTELSKTHIISPTEYEALRADPANNGYKELTSTWAAFRLVAKLRLLSSFYRAEVQPLSEERLAAILQDEHNRNPLRTPITASGCTPEEEPTVLGLSKEKRPVTVATATNTTVAPALQNIGLFKVSSQHQLNQPEPEEREEDGFVLVG